MMQATQTCPKCDGRTFLVTQKFREPDAEGDLHSHALPAMTVLVGEWRSKTLGHLEAWTCLQCGLTELYARDLPDDLAEIVKQHPDQLRIVGAPEQGPYR